MFSSLDNIERAETILLEIVIRHTEEFSQVAEKQMNKIQEKEAIIFHKLTPKIYFSVGFDDPTGMILTARYLCHPRCGRDIEMLIIKDFLNQTQDDPSISLQLK